MPRLLSRPQISRVNARHLLDDLASSYSYSLNEAVLVELIANSLDAHCTNVQIDVNPKTSSLSVTDDGSGMGPDEFEQYHDLAESRKVRGSGIGFAGLGAKLGHKVSRSVATETCSEGHRDSSEWALKRKDLEWRHTRSRSLKHDGTKITLSLTSRSKEMLDEGFVGDTLKRHYGALLDPFMSQIYIWNAVYPGGVTFHVNGEPVAKSPVIPLEAIQTRKEVDIRGRGKPLIGRAVFLMTKEPLPEEARGIAISTYGKSIRRDTLGLYPRRPEYITGWIEAPGLVECLTLNKQDFHTAGPQGAKYRRTRRQLQKAYGEWLQEIGEASEPQERQRAPRHLERETAEILQRIPELRFLFGAQIMRPVEAPDPSGANESTMATEMQPTFGLGGEGPAVGDAPAYQGPDEGESVLPEAGGQTPTRTRRRSVRGGPHIERVSAPDREEIGWVEADTVVINTGHPTYQLAERRRLTGYHERLAIFFTLCREADVDPDERFGLLERALTVWGRA